MIPLAFECVGVAGSGVPTYGESNEAINPLPLK